MIPKATSNIFPIPVKFHVFVLVSVHHHEITYFPLSFSLIPQATINNLPILYSMSCLIIYSNSISLLFKTLCIAFLSPFCMHLVSFLSVVNLFLNITVPFSKQWTLFFLLFFEYIHVLHVFLFLGSNGLFNDKK